MRKSKDKTKLYLTRHLWTFSWETFSKLLSLKKLKTGIFATNKNKNFQRSHFLKKKKLNFICVQSEVTIVCYCILYIILFHLYFLPKRFIYYLVFLRLFKNWWYCFCCTIEKFTSILPLYMWFCFYAKLHNYRLLLFNPCRTNL